MVHLGSYHYKIRIKNWPITRLFHTHLIFECTSEIQTSIVEILWLNIHSVQRFFVRWTHFSNTYPPSHTIRLCLNAALFPIVYRKRNVRKGLGILRHYKAIFPCWYRYENRYSKLLSKWIYFHLCIVKHFLRRYHYFSLLVLYKLNLL